MTTLSGKKQSALFPDFPVQGPVIDLQTGELMPQWLIFFQQLAQACQSNFQKEGVRAPTQNTTDITTIAAKNNLTQLGNIIFDETANVPKILVSDGAGGVTAKTFTIT